MVSFTREKYYIESVERFAFYGTDPLLALSRKLSALAIIVPKPQRWGGHNICG